MKTTILKWICGALVRRWARQAKEAGLQWTPPYDEVAYAKGVAIVRLAQGMRPGTTLRNVQKEGTPVVSIIG